MTVAKLFKLGNAQAVRIPARFRFDTDEVEVTKRGDELILRPKHETAADMFARIRARGADYADWKRPDQGETELVPECD